MSPGSGLPSVAILPQCAESDVKKYTHTKPVMKQYIDSGSLVKNNVA